MLIGIFLNRKSVNVSHPFINTNEYWVIVLFRCRIGDGGWAFDGIEMTSVTESDDGKMVVSCSSTHLTSFAVLVDVAGSLSVSS